MEGVSGVEYRVHSECMKFSGREAGWHARAVPNTRSDPSCAWAHAVLLGRCIQGMQPWAPAETEAFKRASLRPAARVVRLVHGLGVRSDEVEALWLSVVDAWPAVGELDRGAVGQLLVDLAVAADVVAAAPGR